MVTMGFPAMAQKLGAVFLRCVLGPLNYAAGLIIARKVPEGLRELGVENLHGGFARGVDEVAKTAGVGVADVERLLPMGDVSAAAARLDSAQKAALAAWGAHAGHLGGLLTGVADLTVDGRAPDVSQFLARLAKKVVRDAALCEPLEQLSVAVEGWLDLVERCGELVGDGAELTRAYRARRARRLAAIAAGVVIVAIASGYGLLVRSSRARIDATLSASEADPCAAGGVDPGDFARAAEEQKRALAGRAIACDEQQRAARELRAAEEALAAQKRELEKLQKELEARCAALADHLVKGALERDDTAFVGAQAALLERVARNGLERDDLLDVELPCAKSPSGPAIAERYAAAVVASPAAWARPEAIGTRAAAALVKQRDALPSSPKQVLAAHADRVALKALASKDEGARARAMAVCQLKDDLGFPGGKYCGTLKMLAAKKP
jgi:hypothetical protein